VQFSPVPLVSLGAGGDINDPLKTLQTFLENTAMNLMALQDLHLRHPAASTAELFDQNHLANIMGAPARRSEERFVNS
jgi:hypothetical protein